MSQPGWYPDPSGGHEVRWHDGASWTEQVADAGVTSVAPLVVLAPSAAAPLLDDTIAVRVRGQVAHVLRRAAPSAQTGDLFSEPVVVVHNLPATAERASSCALFDAHGSPLGVVGRIVPEGSLSGVLAAIDPRPPTTLRMDVYDRAGVPVLQLARATGTPKWTMAAIRPDGMEVGQIVQRQRTLSSLYTLNTGEQHVGTVVSHGTTSFMVHDADRRPIAGIRAAKDPGAGWLATSAGWVLELYGPLAEPLRTLVPVLPFVLETAEAETAPRGNGAMGI